MPYLGSIPAANYKTVRKQTITGNGGTSYTLDYPVGNDQEIEVYVNNVRQEPGVAYTTSGTALTMTGTVASTDSFYVVFQGKAEQTISIPEKQNDGSYSFDSGFFFIDASNNEIGIGTTAPSSNLHVIGTANVTSNVVIGGTLSVGTANVTSNVVIDGQLVSTSMFKNRIINGMMMINQREANTATDDTYAYDRWNILTESGIVTISATPYANLTNTIPAMMRIRQNITANQRFGAEQIVEYINCRDLRNEYCTLSATVMCSNTTNIRYAILEWIGDADSVTSDVANNWNSSVYTTTAFFPSTGITVANTGVTPLTANVMTDIKLTAQMSSSLNNAIVFFWTEVPQANTVALDISAVQLEKGREKTSYEFRHISHELKMCKRYFQRYGDNGVIVFGVYSTTGNDGYQTYTLQEEMRASPSVTKFGNWTVSNGGQPTFSAYKNMFRITQTVTSTGQAYSQAGTGFYVTFSIEL